MSILSTFAYTNMSIFGPSIEVKTMAHLGNSPGGGVLDHDALSPSGLLHQNSATMKIRAKRYLNPEWIPIEGYTSYSLEYFRDLLMLGRRSIHRLIPANMQSKW